MVGFTVVLATHDGASTLPRVLDAYCAAATPPCEWRLVVVDNGSTDGTADLVRGYVGRLPLQLLSEPRLGKNRALNAAIPAFAGPLVVFTDDDAIPDPDFLVRWSAVADAHPGFTIFGGAIRAAWPSDPPAWLVGSDIPMAGPYSVTPPREEGPVEPEALFGPNMAVRTEVFAAGVSFDEAIGPNGKRYPMGSETSLTLRLARAGHRAWFLPAIRVSHLIRPRQISRAWLRQRASNLGRGVYHHDRIRYLGRGEPEWFGAPRWRFPQHVKTTARELVKLVAASVRGDAARAAAADWRLHVSLGWFGEVIRNAGPRPAPRAVVREMPRAAAASGDPSADAPRG